jgi:hypothetical protein
VPSDLVKIPLEGGLPDESWTIVQYIDDVGSFSWKVGEHQQESWRKNLPPGSYRIAICGSSEAVLRGCDYQSGLSSVFRIVAEGEVINQPPVIDSLSGPANLTVNQLGVWKISAHDPDGNYLTYSVDWGDEGKGAPASAEAEAKKLTSQSTSFTHVYSQAGFYRIKFIVSDEQGASAVGTMSVKIGRAEPTTGNLEVKVLGCSQGQGRSPTSSLAPSSAYTTIAPFCHILYNAVVTAFKEGGSVIKAISTTTTHGVALFEGLEIGEWGVKVEAREFDEGAETDIIIRAGRTTYLTIYLEKKESVVIKKGKRFSPSLAPRNAIVPFTNIIIDPPTRVFLDHLVVERTGLSSDSAFKEVLLIANSKEEDESAVQDKRIIARARLNEKHQAVLEPSNFGSFSQPVDLTIAGLMEDDLAPYAGQAAYLSVVSARFSYGGRELKSVGLPITGSYNVVNNQLNIGSLSFKRRGNSVELKASSVEDMILEKIVLFDKAQKQKGVRINYHGRYYEYDCNRFLEVYEACNLYKDPSLSKYRGFRIQKESTATIEPISDTAYLMTPYDIRAKGDIYGYGIIAKEGEAEKPSITIISPNGGERWQRGEIRDIQWTSQNLPSDVVAVTINSTEGYLRYYTIDERVTAVSGILRDWVVGRDYQGNDIPSGKYSLRICPVDDDSGNIRCDWASDRSDGDFSIVEKTGEITSITLTAPNGGESWEENSSQKIRWRSSGAISKVKIELMYWLGSSLGWRSYTIADSTANDGDYVWNIPSGFIDSKLTGSPISFRIKISSLDGSYSDQSDNTFKIIQGAIPAPSLSLSLAPDAIDTTAPAGQIQHTFAYYYLSAEGSTEALSLKSLQLAYDYDALTATDLNNCQLWDGGTPLNTGADVVDPTTASDFIVFRVGNYTIDKGETKKLALKCDIVASARDVYRWGVNGQAEVLATGLSSGQPASASIVGGWEPYVSVTGSGFLTVSLHPSSPSSRGVEVGTANVVATALKVSAANEDIKLDRLALQYDGSTPIDLVNNRVSIYDGSTKVGEAIFAVGDHATSTFQSDVIVPKTESKVLTLKVDLAPAGTVGNHIAINYDGQDLQGTRGIGMTTGSVIYSSTRADTDAGTITLTEKTSGGIACTDSDGGEIYDKQGITKGYDSYGGNIDQIASYQDECDSSTRLKEFYCSYQNDPHNGAGYVAMVNKTCDYGCQSGVCKSGITVISPNGGESWNIGSSVTIRWSSEGIGDKVGITLHDYRYRKNYAVASNLSSELGSYQWTIPSSITPSPLMRIRVWDQSSTIDDYSDSYFEIASGGASQAFQISQLANSLKAAEMILDELMRSLRGF